MQFTTVSLSLSMMFLLLRLTARHEVSLSPALSHSLFLSCAPGRDYAGEQRFWRQHRATCARRILASPLVPPLTPALKFYTFESYVHAPCTRINRRMRMYVCTNVHAYHMNDGAVMWPSSTLTYIPPSFYFNSRRETPALIYAGVTFSRIWSHMTLLAAQTLLSGVIWTLFPQNYQLGGDFYYSCCLLLVDVNIWLARNVFLLKYFVYLYN